MRRFVIIGHEAPTAPEFSLDDLPGNAGRLDLLCRCVGSALLRSHGIREDAEIVTVHQDTLSIRFAGRSVRRLNPDERSTAARVRTALEAATDAVGAIEVEASPGIFVSRKDLDAVLADSPGSIVQLVADGDPITTFTPDCPVTFVLSDHRPFTERDEARIAAVADERVSLGSVAIHADQAITVAHNYLDTDGYRTYGSEGL